MKIKVGKRRKGRVEGLWGSLHVTDCSDTNILTHSISLLPVMTPLFTDTVRDSVCNPYTVAHELDMRIYQTRAEELQLSVKLAAGNIMVGFTRQNLLSFSVFLRHASPSRGMYYHVIK
jgi:hypothetical protein